VAKKLIKFDFYYLEIRTVKNPKNFTMDFIQCELLHPIVKVIYLFVLFYLFKKISILKVELAKMSLEF
jgi:hypothetical protein